MSDSPTCIRPSCDRPKAIVIVDGKRKRAKTCRKHIANRYRDLLEPQKRRECHGTNFLGEPCRSVPLCPGKEYWGVTVSGDYCLAHDPDLQEVPMETKGFGGPQPNAGRPKLPSKSEIALRMIEEAAAELIAEQMKIAVSGEKPVVVGNGAHAEVEMAPDLAARLRAADSLLDRLMGRARVTTEIIGGIGPGSELKKVPRTEDRAADVAAILGQAGAIPHGGRRRSAPSEKAKQPEN